MAIHNNEVITGSPKAIVEVGKYRYVAEVIDPYNADSTEAIISAVNSAELRLRAELQNK
jgi:hypothetical protein